MAGVACGGRAAPYALLGRLADEQRATPLIGAVLARRPSLGDIAARFGPRFSVMVMGGTLRVTLDPAHLAAAGVEPLLDAAAAIAEGLRALDGELSAVAPGSALGRHQAVVIAGVAVAVAALGALAALRHQ